MKIFFVFATVLLAVSALPAQEQWTSFKAKHGKSYENLYEEKVRFKIFQNNVQVINAHNARYEAGLETYTMGVNKFTDLTPKEFRAMLRLQNGPLTWQNLTRHVQNGTAPDSIDWREKNAVLEVQDQNGCGSCWAFSAVGALEGQNAIKNNKRVLLSKQQLIDCDKNENGCNGGLMLNAFEYVKQHGLNSEADYPYDGFDLKCRAKSDSAVTVKEVVALDATESALEEAVGTVGPISVALNADLLQNYEGGILDKTCSAYLNHGVVAVGYGIENGKKFWILKNSWSHSWGEKGFFRLAKDANNLCGIGLNSSYPVLA